MGFCNASKSIVVLVVCLAATILIQPVLAGEKDSYKGEGQNLITSVPRTLSYQGILKDSAGDPVTDSVYNVTFRFFNVESGGTSLWDEILPCTTSVGYFNAMFSNVNIPFDEDYWLEMEVGGEILDPRQKMSMVGYAAAADTAEYAWNTAGGGANGWVDDGTVVRLETETDSVGIGTLIPSEKFEVGGNILINGKANIGSGNTNTGVYAFVAGQNNSTDGDYSVISGGYNNNTIDSECTIGGGNGNTAGAIGTVGGGYNNVANYGEGCTVAGGESNQATGDGAFVGGGYINTASGLYSTTSGGKNNSVSGQGGTISGGEDNYVASQWSVISGGYADTIVTGADYSYLFGIGSKLTQDSTFLVDMPHVRFGDESTGYEFPSSDGSAGQLMATDGSGLVSWTDPTGASSGWVDDGTVVRLETITDKVGIGTETPTKQLEVVGDVLVNGNAAIGEANTNDGENALVVGANNWVNSDYSSICGGRYNEAHGSYSAIGGGNSNQCTNSYVSIGGGYSNSVGDGDYTTIAGGYNNYIEGLGAVISGGRDNEAYHNYTVIGGGYDNSGLSQYSTISGGTANIITSGAAYSFISGGSGNSADGQYVTIGGGLGNSNADYNYVTIAGGRYNYSEGATTVIGGGEYNQTIGDKSVVSGGGHNEASGTSSFIGGGEWNYTGGEYSAILGGYGDTIAATGDYSYLFGINSDLTQDSTFMVDMPYIRFGDESTGYEFPTEDGSAGQVMATDGAGLLSWTDISSGGWINEDTVVYLDPDTARVGIGISTPGEKLEVAGNIKATGTIISGNSITIDGINDKIMASGGTINFDNDNILTTGKATIGVNHINNGSNAFVVGSNNQVYGFCSTIGGGLANLVSYDFGAIGGGRDNNIHQYCGIIAGGGYNEIQNTNYSYGTIGGGLNNIIGAGSYNTIGGGAYNNCYAEDTDFRTIAGGHENIVRGDNSSIGGGYSNEILGTNCTISGGNNNTISFSHSTISGGVGNSVLDLYGTIGGGMNNSVDFGSVVSGGGTNHATGSYCSIGGGTNNNAVGDISTIAGGRDNSATDVYASVCGGFADTASGYASVVVGGIRNVASSDSSFVGGGASNRAQGRLNVIVGGMDNSVSGSFSAIAGGNNNNCRGSYSAILGGTTSTDSSNYSTIAGGAGNILGLAAVSSMIFGSSMYVTQAFRVGFFNSTYYGGLGINRDANDGGINWPIHAGTNTTNGNGAYLTPTGQWFNTSAKNKKEDFRKFVRTNLFDKISGIEVESWQYKDSRERHIGPYAEEFNEAFGTGAYDLDGNFHNDAISGNDVAGVALAGVKELIQENRELRDLILHLERRITELENR